ncbi:flagellar assembly protein FliW [Dehalobacter restrictus DSM 9455]|uniref:Flagellar assembly factor FliW n=2 Tax=Dehalobacter restrictus TaxID=55583 RepID=A0ABN4BUB0_DEHRP|nr:flagellar assembly protein FliW [Dehalobacter restrictus DSM 9455]
MNDMSRTLIRFPKGIPGFEGYFQYHLMEEENSLLTQLLSAEDVHARFIIVRPQIFFPDYLSTVDLGQEEAELLEVTPDDKLEVWAILTLCQQDMQKTTINLRAPIVINRRTGKGAQFILSKDSLLSRQPLFSELETDCNEGTMEGVVG